MFMSLYNLWCWARSNPKILSTSLIRKPLLYTGVYAGGQEGGERFREGEGWKEKEKKTEKVSIFTAGL